METEHFQNRKPDEKLLNACEILLDTKEISE